MHQFNPSTNILSRWDRRIISTRYINIYKTGINHFPILYILNRLNFLNFFTSVAHLRSAIHQFNPSTNILSRWDRRIISTRCINIYKTGINHVPILYILNRLTFLNFFTSVAHLRERNTSIQSSINILSLRDRRII
jgi:hypothetical protein